MSRTLFVKTTLAAIACLLLVGSVAQAATVLFPSGGGTGWGSIKPGTVLIGNGTDRLATTSAATNGQVLQYNGSTWVPAATSTLGILNGGAASTTLLGDSNTFSGKNVFSSIANSTVIGNFDGVLYASAFSGADQNARIDAAYAALPSTGGTVMAGCGTFTSATALNFSTSNKPVVLKGCGSNATTLIYTGQSTSTTFRTGQQGDVSSGMEDLTISGTSTTDIAPGVEMGGGGGSFAYGHFKNVHVTKLGIGWYPGTNTYIVNWSHVISDFNANSFVVGNGTNQNEGFTFTDGTLFSDGRNSVAHPYDNCISITPKASQGAPSFELIGIEHDKCGVFVGPEVNLDVIASHGEIVTNSNPAYNPFTISGDSNTTVNHVGGHELNGNDAAHSPACTYTLDGNANLTIEGTAYSSYGGYVIPTLVCNTGTGNRTYLAPQNIAGTGWTTLETSTETPGTFKVGYFIGNHLGLGTTTSTGLLNLDGPFPQIAGGNGGSGGGVFFAGVTNSGNGIGGGKLTFSASNSSTASFLTAVLASGFIGVGSTTPFKQFSVGSGNTGTFAISTSTPGCAQFATSGELYSTGSSCGSGSGTVTAVSINSANGFAGSSGGGATPALTLSTTITGLLKGNGTAISAAALTDFPTIANGTFLANGSGGTAAPNAIATSSIFGTGIGGQSLAWNNGVPQWIASTTYANGAGISTAFANGQLTITNTGALFSYPFPSNATSTQITFNGGAVFVGATTTGTSYAQTGMAIGSSTGGIATAPLEINPQRSSSGLYTVAHFNYSGSGGTVGDGACINWADNTVRDCVYAQSGYKRIWITNSVEQMRLGSNGFLGIGTSTAQTILVAQGPAQFVIASGVATSTCNTAIEGSQVYNLGNHHLWLCMGSEPWTLLK
jgi:hypothetical protein